MASSRRGFVPVDTTTTLTKRRRLSSFNTCLHSGIDKWNDIFSFNPCNRRRHSFQTRQPRQKVHFHPHSSFSTSSRYSSSTFTHRPSFSSTTPLKPILKSSAAYRNSMQASRASTSISTPRPSTSRASTTRPSTSPDSTDSALQDAHSVAHTLVTMQSVSTRLTTFRAHLSHLTHRLTILTEAEAEQSLFLHRHNSLQRQYLACLSRQSDVMNELARGVSVEVAGVKGCRRQFSDDDEGSQDGGRGRDTEGFLGRKIAFEPEAQRMGREVDVLDVERRHTAIRQEMEVLDAKMVLEAMERGRAGREWGKMRRELGEEVADVVGELEVLGKIARRSGARERREVEKLRERLVGLKRGFEQRSCSIAEAWVKMERKAFVKR